MLKSIILSLLILSSCGGFKLFNESPKNDRKISSLSVESLVAESNENFGRELDEKFNSIHYYYVLAQKNLYLFDSLISRKSIGAIYRSPAYLKLLAVRSQVEEIEHEITSIAEKLNSTKDNNSKKLLLVLKISQFAKASRMKAYSMDNLIERINLDQHNLLGDFRKIKGTKSLSLNEIEKEYQQLQGLNEFQVYEKNIEHLSYMLESKLEISDKKFYPSISKAGNITGNEFPAKVWSLTFDDGPGKATTPVILDNLLKKGLKATFFQLMNQVHNNPALALKIRDAGMEIASHSYSHQQLTKVNEAALEKEITVAVQELKKHHSLEIKFYRLPYGAGVSSPNIREKIAANDLIHVFWNVDTLDWMAQAPEQIVSRTISLMKKTGKDSGVILFHDIHQRTVEATPKIMDYLKQDNRRVCTLEEIVTQMNEGIETVCPAK
jgi:peptidoglycan/xylan/chitin deacetylase (PgdA/CDA1 family)